MPVDAAILGFSNRWYAAMMARAIEVTVAPGRVVRIVSPPYLLATKLEAFAHRGEGDYLFSQDIGDIVALVDGRHELVTEVHEEDRDVHAFVGDRLRRLLDDARFVESIPAHLMPDAASQARVPLILERMVGVARGDGPSASGSRQDTRSEGADEADRRVTPGTPRHARSELLGRTARARPEPAAPPSPLLDQTPSDETLQRYAEAVGCEIKIELVPKVE